MSLIINHNLMAQNAARNLNAAYSNLATSVQRLSSGLRVNSGADDAAGLAIREMMRADIATSMQGLRNAADAISLIQTADGALAVIDEKLIRMKELAEQAATGTYTTAQREIINSEYQAMAAEIDRIANAVEFNGMKLLDGSVSNQHGGQGLKIHFGLGNNPAEDYYFVNMGDARATSTTGLRIGGDAKNDIWGQGAAGAAIGGGPGCCTAGFTSLNSKAGFTDGQSFSYGYNWDWLAQNYPGYENGDPNLLTGKYLAGRYTVTSAETLQDLIDKVNAGVQSRVGIHIDAAGGKYLTSGASMGICVGDEAYIWGNMAAAVGGDGPVTTYNYTYTVNDYFANDDHSVITNSATVARELFGSARPLALTATVQGPADPAAAAAEINRQITQILADGKFVGSFTSATPAISASASTGLYLKALDYMSLTKQVGMPQILRPEDIAREGWRIEYEASGYTANHHSGAGVTLQDVYGWAIDPLQLGDRVVSDIWVNQTGTKWTTSATLGAQLEAWNNAEDGEGWHRLSIQIQDGDDYITIRDKFNTALVMAHTQVTGIVVGDQNSSAGGVLNGNSAFGIWYASGGSVASSLGFWTTVPGVASALNLTSSITGGAATGGNFTSGTSLSDYVNAFNALVPTLAGLNTQVISTHSIVSNTGGTGVGTLAINYWTNGDGLWTDERKLGEAMGFTQVVLDLTYNQKITDIMDQLSRALGGDGGGAAAETYFNSKTFSEVNRTIDAITVGQAAARQKHGDDVVVHRDGFIDQSKQITMVGTGMAGFFNAYSLVSAINHNQNSQYWAMLDQLDDTKLYVFRKDGGDNNHIQACDVYDVDRISQAMAQTYVDFEHVETGTMHKGGTTLSLGTTATDVWAKLKPMQTREQGGNQVWNVTLNGKDVGDDRDLWIAAARELRLPGIDGGFDDIINGMDRYSFVELQDASNGTWAGADVRTQSAAQAALDALDYSITVKDKIRADLGAMQNRLQNTMTALEIQAENLQASESRISDVDVAAEMTAFTRSNILTQAATGMLAQANSLGQLALSLIGG